MIRLCGHIEATDGDHGTTAVDIAHAVYTSAGADPIVRDDTACRWIGTAIPVASPDPAPSSKGAVIAVRSRLQEVR
ncbi:hypothetical protein ACFWFQ_20650 [Nocardia salmonicida]|uniref:hypothetical protein n=1 Tax=Nocardia salmonicida TaxID=53431 RepID=UPI0036482A20